MLMTVSRACANTLLGRKEKSARQLLRERRSALSVAMKVEDVVAHRAHDAPIIDAAMLKKAAVLNGDDGMHKIGRNLVVGEHAALGALGALAQAGDEQRLELVARKSLAVLVGDGLTTPPLTWMVALSGA